MKAAVALCASLLMCLGIAGCGTNQSLDNEPNEISSNEPDETSSSEEDDQSSKDVKEREEAEEVAKTAVEGTFSKYLTQEGENFLFDSEHSVSIKDKEVILEVTANFPIPVPKGAWDIAVSEGIDSVTKSNEHFDGFRDLLQEHVQGFLQYAYQELGALTQDWSDQFTVVLIVYNSDGEVLSEYR
jgi:hypothetical protein